LHENDKNLPAAVVSINIKIKKGQFEEARRQIQDFPQNLFTPDERMGLLSLVDVSSGVSNSSHFLNLIETAKDKTAHHAHSYLFMTLAMMGEFERAFEVLENLFQHQSSILLLGFSDPLGENIHTTPKYHAYHEKVYGELKADKEPLKKTKSNPLDDVSIQIYLDRLEELMNQEQPFLNPALTLRLLADSMDIHPNQLSWLLNEKLGKNFNEFINGKRINHFKKLIVDPSNSHISLIGLAYESGFNSKTVFNTVFKKLVGQTPKEYQKSQFSE
jgi:AraC-like DNA-binding protein